MSQSEVERFVESLKNDEALRTELAGHASGVGSIVEFANDKGYSITADEASAYIQAQSSQELSDEQLDAVAGGKGHVGATTQTVATTTSAATVAEAVTVVVLT